MITIRALEKTDISSIREIHERFYSNEFECPNFFDKFLCGYIVEDGNHNVICAGGIRNIPEAIIVTDKSLPVKLRREALLKVLDASQFIARKFGHEHLHAFVQNSQWCEQLKKYGFAPTKGIALSIGV